MEDKIRKILLDNDFLESDKGSKTFNVKNGILTITISEPTSGETINEEIRQTREHLLQNIETKILTLCTVDDTGGILMHGKEKIGEINRIDGVMEMDLNKLQNNGSTKG